MLAGAQSRHPQLMVKRHPHADRDEVHVRMLDHFVSVGKSMGNSEMLGRFVCGFLAARADRRDLELRKRAQSRNVGIPPPAVAHICSNDANTDFFCRHGVFYSYVLRSRLSQGPNYSTVTSYVRVVRLCGPS